MANMRGRRQGFSIFNVLTAMVLASIVLGIIGLIVGVILVANGTLDLSVLQTQVEEEPAALPTMGAVAAAPTGRPTTTETPLSLLATYTPEATDAVPQEATNTRRPTATPSITSTFPPPTPTRTPTATPTLTPTATLTPSPTPIGPPPTATNTRSPFPFTKTNDSPLYLRNFANSAGCNWLGVAGEVLDINGNPVAPGAYIVHVWESGVDTRVGVGGAPAYGPSGWEQFLFDSPVVRNYNLQLETVNGTPVSQVYQITTMASCNQNLVYMIFIQNH